MPEQQGPFVASDEKTEDGTPVGVEVTAPAPGAGAHTPERTGGDAEQVDETGALDELGESRRSEAPDPILDDDVPNSADRDEQP
jgi:hypothetical protein